MVVTVILPVLGILIAFLVYKVQKRQLHAFKWSQVSKTTDLLSVWSDAHMTNIRRDIDKYIDYIKVEPVQMSKLTKEGNYKKAEKTFISLLNYLDLVSLAYLKSPHNRL